jgi:hypothetical protein
MLKTIASCKSILNASQRTIELYHSVTLTSHYATECQHVQWPSSDQRLCQDHVEEPRTSGCIKFVTPEHAFTVHRLAAVFSLPASLIIITCPARPSGRVPNVADKVLSFIAKLWGKYGKRCPSNLTYWTSCGCFIVPLAFALKPTGRGRPRESSEAAHPQGAASLTKLMMLRKFKSTQRHGLKSRVAWQQTCAMSMAHEKTGH